MALSIWPQRAIIHSIHPLPVENHRLSVAHDLCFDLVGVQHYKNIAQNQDKAGFLCAFNYSSWNLNNCLSFCRTTAQCVVPISGRYNTGGLTCSPLRPLCLCVKTPQTGAHFWTQGIVLSYHTDCRVTRCGDWRCQQVWQSTPAVKRLFQANPIENISSSDSVFMLFPHCEARNTFVFTGYIHDIILHHHGCQHVEEITNHLCGWVVGWATLLPHPPWFTTCHKRELPLLSCWKYKL